MVLLDLDLGDGTTAERNVAAIRAAGLAVLVLSASDRPAAVRDAMRAGARGYVLKHEEAAELRAAIRAVAAGTDWVSPRLARIFATDDAPDRPSLSTQETRTLRLYATGMPIKSVARRLGISEEMAKQYVRRVRESTHKRTGQRPPNWTCTIEPSRTGISLLRPSQEPPPPGRGDKRCPSSAYSLRRDDKQAIRGVS